MDNKVITSQGNVQFQFPDGKIVNVHPNHIYTVFSEDTVNFVLVGLPKSSGLAMMSSKAEDLEVNGQKYTFDELPSVLEEAFAIAGAQARCEIVDELPESGYTNTIYLVPQEEGEGYDEYIWLKDEERWELIGDTDIEMKNYLKKVDFNAYSAATKVIIDDEISARTQGDITLDGKIDQEIADRASDVDAEEARAISAETELQTAIDDEISARTDADTAEQTAREAADSFISGAVDTVSSGLTQEVQRAQNAESGLSDAIDAEEARALAAEEALSGAVDTVSSNLDNEVSRATSAETELSNAIQNEATAREAADEALSGAVDTVSGSLDTFVSDFNTYSGNVATALGEKASQSDLDALNDTVTSHTADTSIHLTSGDVQTQIEDAISGKLDTNVFEAYSAETDARIAEDEEVTSAALNAINDRLSEDEEVTAAGLNSLNEALSGKVDVNDVYTKTEVDDALVGKVNTSDFEAYSGAVETALASKADTSAVTAVQDSLSGYVYTADNGKQDIYGKKTFIGQKRLNFTQAKSSDKLGFTLYDVRDEQGNAKEFAAFELNPIGITENGVTHPLLTLNHYRTNSGRDVQTYFGYRQYDQPHSASYHLLVPLPEIAKTPLNLTAMVQNFYMPLGFKNGSTMIKADNAGVVNLSSEFGGKVNTSAITTSVTSASTDAQVPSAKAVYDAIQEGGGSSYTAGDGINITNDVISVSGVSHNSLEDGTKMLLRGNVTSSNQNYTNIGFEYYYGTSNNKNEINLKPLTINGKSALRTQETSISVIDTSAITTSISSGSTDAQVPSAKAVNDKLGGLSLVKLTESEYQALVDKDPNVLYVVIPDQTNP